jgi:hypothetical protein
MQGSNNMPYPYTFPAQANPDLSREQQQVFGVDAILHEISGMPIEMGSGCLSPDEQVLRVHLPEIARIKGRAAAEAMLIRLNAKQRKLKIVKSSIGE